jgi:16S rRNA processing protein RimM
MITREEITPIGKFNKPHGINGELSATITAPLDVMHDCKCLMCDIDGIYVPFFVNGVRSKSQESFLLTIDGIANEQEAAILVNKDIFVLTSDYTSAVENDDELPVDFFIGFDAQVNNTIHGTVQQIDDTTANVLFVLTLDDGKELLIPAVDDFISHIDVESRHIKFDIPQELLDL